MKIKLTTLLVIFSCFTCFGQADTTKIPFISYWSAGDSYDFKVTKIKQRWTEDNLTKNDSSSYIVNFEVIDSTETSYKIKWSHKTDLVGLSIPAELLGALSKYDMTEVIYTTSEVGDFTGIENWQEISAMMKELFTNMIDLLAMDEEISKKDLTQAMLPIMNMYETREGIELLLFKELNYFHFPFGIEFSPSDTITYEEELPNMFGGDPIRGNSKLYFEEVDFEESRCVLIQEMDLNPEDTRNLLTTVFKQMKLDDKEMEEATKTAQFEIKDYNRYEYYYYPGIPINIETKRETVMDFNTEKGKAIEITRIELVEPEETPQVIQTTPTNQQTGFEGKIIYDLKIKDKSGEMTKKQAKMFFGNEQIYTIKGDKYKSEMNGMMKMSQIYLGQDTVYSQIGGMKNLLWIDATSNPDKLIDFNIQKNAKTIAGLKCDLLTIRSEEGVTKYYFNEKYSVNPDNFKHHEYGFWKFCIDKTNSMPLKTISDMEDMYIEITAKEVRQMEIDDAEFELPNLPRVESPEK